MKPLCISLLVLTSLALLPYPLVLMANVMSIAAIQDANPRPIAVIASTAFFWSSTLYPLVYLAGLIASIWNFRKNIRHALFWQLGVIGYLVLVVSAFITWLMCG